MINILFLKLFKKFVIIVIKTIVDFEIFIYFLILIYIKMINLYLKNCFAFFY